MLYPLTHPTVLHYLSNGDFAEHSPWKELRALVLVMVREDGSTYLVTD